MYFKTRFYFEIFFLELQMHSSLTICSLFLLSFSAEPLTSKNRQMLRNVPFETSLSKEKRKNASIVHLWADDSLAFGLASFCNHLSTHAEYEWKIPKYTLKGHDNFLESFGTQHNELFTANGNSVIRRKLLEVLVCLWSVGRGQGKELY